MWIYVRPRTYVVVLWLDVSLGVLVMEVTQFGGEGVGVVEQRDAVVNAAEHSLRMRLELWRVRVITVHAREQLSSLWVVVKHPTTP